MTRFQSQNSNDKIVLFNKNVQQNELNLPDSVQNKKGDDMQIPLIS